MAHASVVESPSVVVDSHRAVGDLVAAVAVDIGHAQVVITLSGIVGPLGVVCVEHPVGLQLMSVPVPGCDDAAGVIAATKDAAGVDAVEIGHTRQETVGAVGILVAPVVEVAAFGDIGFGVEGTACETVEDGDVFVARQDTARHRTLAVVVARPFLTTVKRTFFLRRHLAFSLSGLGFHDTVTVVGCCIADDVPDSVGSAVGGPDHQLRLAVAVEVVDHERHVMGTAADVAAHVDTPEPLAVETIAVEEGRTGEAVVGIVVGVRGVPLQDDLVLPVAVDISDAGIIGDIEVRLSRRRNTVGRLLYRNGDIALGGIGLQGVRAVLAAAPHFVDDIATEGRFIDIEGAARL